VQEVATLVRNPTIVRGILGIVKSWGVGTKDGVQKVSPLTKNPTYG